MTPPIVLDNTVLTNFALVNHADWVIDLLGDDAWTTTAALGEYRASVADGTLPPAVWQALVVVTPTSEETHWFTACGRVWAWVNALAWPSRYCGRRFWPAMIAGRGAWPNSTACLLRARSACS